ncbi:MAG TPA: type II toxin-antitoxin system RelE/ParE family toxin [Anaeromyxobacteraceae bacterium]|nr:type II toxin-antitoxin system RelE/ParE family toxin [Anaeromyxobacteraceae bacterium]
MKVELSAEAQAQVDRIDAWWRENRRAAPNLFAEELEEALRALAVAPALGVRYPRRPGVRRLLLNRTHYHLYLLEEATRVYVVAIWSAYRGRGPRL